jgi:hypothetical protein
MFKRRIKYFLIAEFILLIVAIPLMYISIEQQKTIYLNNLIHNESSYLNSEKESFEISVFNHINYAIALSRLVEGHLDANLSKEKLENLENIFYLQFDELGECAQIRFIDSSGMERIRINSTSNGKEKVDAGELQYIRRQILLYRGYEIPG